ncbi:MAG: sodium-translocating pyrophosphatase [Candidatus Coatesbacteria bacterium]
MSEAKIVLPALQGLELNLLYWVLASAGLALAYGLYLAIKVQRADAGPEKMQVVARAIREGALAYLKRQFKVMGIFVVALAAVLFALYWQNYTPADGLKPDELEAALHLRMLLSWGVAGAFLAGCAASYGAGYVGMTFAVKGNVRAAARALTSPAGAMTVAFDAGTVSGMFTVGFGLLGATIIFLIFKQDAMKILVGFGFGGSLVALFMRVGGGIYTKAADVGADLVGKVEKNIPEDDPRNAATIADNVGDNVGDCAGMAADVFESYEVTLVAAIILAAATQLDTAFLQIFRDALGPKAPQAAVEQAASMYALKLVVFALLIRAVGVVASILGVWAVRPTKESMKNPMRPINTGYTVAVVVAGLGIWLLNKYYLINPVTGLPDYRFTYAGISGLVLAFVTLWLTNYFVHPEYRPVREVTQATRSGAAPMLIAGLAEGMESSVWAALVIAGTIMTSILLFPESQALAAFGIAVAGLGLLSTTGFILAMDTFGPITDNAHGIFEMSGVKNATASKSLAWMDAIGNTTKALTKGLAIATAVIAAISLFRSFIDEAGLGAIGIQVNLPDVFIGVLIGGAVPFLFSAFALKAVGRAAFFVVAEVRRQFKQFPGIMKGTQKPDYAACVDIVTAAAQKELVGPGLVAIAAPVFTGFLLGPAALGGFLCGAILTGQLLAVFMANTGGIWDNAKKTIEDGLFGGKGTPEHKAAVVGDTVGDPFKDTAGPALNPLIKVMNLVALLIIPVVMKFNKTPTGYGVAAVMAVLVVVAVMMNRSGSLGGKKK